MSCDTLWHHYFVVNIVRAVCHSMLCSFLFCNKVDYNYCGFNDNVVSCSSSVTWPHMLWFNIKSIPKYSFQRKAITEPVVDWMQIHFKSIHLWWNPSIPLYTLHFPSSSICNSKQTLCSIFMGLILSEGSFTSIITNWSLRSVSTNLLGNIFLRKRDMLPFSFCITFTILLDTRRGIRCVLFDEAASSIQM